jgi:hypothetical protein
MPRRLATYSPRRTLAAAHGYANFERRAAELEARVLLLGWLHRIALRIPRRARICPLRNQRAEANGERAEPRPQSLPAARAYRTSASDERLKAEVAVASDASAQDKLLAYTGRGPV